MVSGKDDAVMDQSGLSSRDMDLIRGVFRRHREISAAMLYGSRAQGTHRPESDINLTIQGDFDDLRAASIAAEMDELPLPYRFDVQAYATVQSAALRDDIRRTGTVVYGEWK
jgi:predicted nucleotidyltransferase